MSARSMRKVRHYAPKLGGAHGQPEAYFGTTRKTWQPPLLKRAPRAKPGVKAICARNARKTAEHNAKAAAAAAKDAGGGER